MRKTHHFDYAEAPSNNQHCRRTQSQRPPKSHWLHQWVSKSHKRCLQLRQWSTRQPCPRQAPPPQPPPSCLSCRLLKTRINWRGSSSLPAVALYSRKRLAWPRSPKSVAKLTPSSKVSHRSSRRLTRRLSRRKWTRSRLRRARFLSPSRSTASRSSVETISRRKASPWRR